MARRDRPIARQICVGARDMDAMVSLLPEEVRIGRDASGRLALRAHMDRMLPHLPGGNTAVPVTMIAEKTAEDMILERLPTSAENNQSGVTL